MQPLRQAHGRARARTRIREMRRRRASSPRCWRRCAAWARVGGSNRSNRVAQAGELSDVESPSVVLERRCPRGGAASNGSTVSPSAVASVGAMRRPTNRCALLIGERRAWHRDRGRPRLLPTSRRCTRDRRARRVRRALARAEPGEAAYLHRDNAATPAARRSANPRRAASPSIPLWFLSAQRVRMRYRSNLPAGREAGLRY
jgi:hypothetical protein